MINTWSHFIKTFFVEFTLKKMVCIVVGAAILSFGLYNVHQQCDITEGGVLGLLLFVKHWLGISPAIMTLVLDGSCYLLAFRYLGMRFIIISAISTLSVSACFKLWEQFPPVFPNLSGHPFFAAVLGGLFVGIGVGMIVRQGGSSGGDDALALVIAKKTECRLSRAYLFTDFTVLALSLSYIPVVKILFSILTVTVSSFVIDLLQSVGNGGNKMHR